MLLNLGRRLCWCATCLQSKVKVRKTHKSSLLRKRSEFTLRPAYYQFMRCAAKVCSAREIVQADNDNVGPLSLPGKEHQFRPIQKL